MRRVEEFETIVLRYKTEMHLALRAFPVGQFSAGGLFSQRVYSHPATRATLREIGEVVEPVKSRFARHTVDTDAWLLFRGN